MPNNKKATFVLPNTLLEEIRALVKRGQAESMSSFVREGLESNLRRYREENIRREFERAAEDPDFMKDLNSTMSAYRTADAETASLIKDDLSW